MKVTEGLVIGRLKVVKDLGTTRGSAGKSVRRVRVLCSECGETSEITASNFKRMSWRKCATFARVEGREARRRAEREQRAIVIARRKQQRIATNRVPLSTQQEILSLWSVTEPLAAPGFITRKWHVGDLAKKFRITEHVVIEILRGTYGGAR